MVCQLKKLLIHVCCRAISDNNVNMTIILDLNVNILYKTL